LNRGTDHKGRRGSGAKEKIERRGFRNSPANKDFGKGGGKAVREN